MNASFKTFFFLKKGFRYQGGPMPVYVRINVDGKRVELSLQRTCQKSKWNQKTGRAIGSKMEVLQLNTYLDAVQGAIYEIQKEFVLRHEPITAVMVKQRLIGRVVEKQHTLIEVFQ